MTQMKDRTVEKITKILDSEPSIRLEMNRGLINVRALARYIIKEKKIDATLEAVISIIRRYQLGEMEDIFEKARKALKHVVTISAKNQLASVALTKNDEVQHLLPKLFSIINYAKGDVLRIIQADESIKILVDGKNIDKVKTIFSQDEIMKITPNIAEINIHVDPKAFMPPGVVAIIANELAINDITIQENLSCFPESLWFVEEKDVTKAYDVIYKLCHL